MTFIRRIIDGVVKKIVEFGVGRAASAAFIFLASGGWIFVWKHVNPEYTYKAWTSSVVSHFAGLGPVLHEITVDSRQYCSGGWGQRLGRIGLRRCYSIRFVPRQLYQMYVCLHDESPIVTKTSDQLTTLRQIEQQVEPLKCFVIVYRASNDSVEVVQGSDASSYHLEFGASPPEGVFFCGCSELEVKNDAKAMGGQIKQ